jgi:hypothetical protein
MFMSDEQNARHNHHIKTVNKSLENVTYVEYLDITLTDKNKIHEDINLLATDFFFKF